MKRATVSIAYFWMALSLVACSKVWLPDERSGLGIIDSHLQLIPSDSQFRPKEKVLERTIRVPFDPTDRSIGSFDLYYFVRMPGTGQAAKTVLFSAGGPGQSIPATIAMMFTDFLTDNGYNVVYYHPRGAGFSQISERNKYDRFLKTSYVAQDIEAIRGNFLGPNGKWDAVIGYSFGTVVAQYYAGAYASSVDRLILIGTQSRHGFQTSPGSFDQITSEILARNRATLERIFARMGTTNTTILDRVFGTPTNKGIFQNAEEKFGSLAFIANAYCDLKNELANNNLNYSQRFFKALRGLRDVGWSPAFSRQVEFANDIINELSGTASSVDDCGPDLTGQSDRVFYAVSIYDGINMRFLSKWLANGKKDVHDATQFMGGEIHYANGGINRYIDKVGISNNESIEPWDPAQHKYAKQTLILKGGADTVPAGGAAEHIFLNALTGPRTLIEFLGTGHLHITPLLPSGFQSTLPGNPMACTPSQTPTIQRPIRDCLIYYFLTMDAASFNNPSVNTILPVIANQGASICYRDQTLPQTSAVAGTCP